MRSPQPRRRYLEPPAERFTGLLQSIDKSCRPGELRHAFLWIKERYRLLGQHWL